MANTQAGSRFKELEALDQKIKTAEEAAVKARKAADSVADKYGPNAPPMQAAKSAETALTDLRTQRAALAKKLSLAAPFEFHGGSPRQFITEFQNHFQLDWGNVLTIAIPNSEVHVPSMVVSEGPWSVIDLYNHLGDYNPGLGQWIIEGDYDKPSVVMLSPGKGAGAMTLAAGQSSGSAMKVKALPIGNIPKESWELLQKNVEMAAEMANEYAAGNGSEQRYNGRMYIQADAKVVIVMGTPDYLDLVASVIGAYDQAPVEEVEVRIFHLQYARAEDLVNLVKASTNVAEVAVDGRTNSLVISALPSHMTAAVDLISRLDIPVDQTDTKKPAL